MARFVLARTNVFLYLGEDITSIFASLMNKTISVNKYLEKLSSHHCKINELYLRNGDIKPPEKFSKVDVLYVELLSVLYDIVCIPNAVNNDDVTILSKNLLVKYKSILCEIDAHSILLC